MNVLTYVIIILTIFGYFIFMIHALAEDERGKYIAKAVVIPTLVLSISLGISLIAAYLTKPSISNITVWSPFGVSYIVFLLSYFIWLPLSFWSILRLTFPIFQKKYGLTKSDFRDFAGMNIFNKKKKIERWLDRISLSSFDFKK